MVYETPPAAPDEPALDAVFGALAHAARRHVMRQLLDGAPSMGVGELAEAAGMSPQLLNKHATTLERAGLISRERAGREKRVQAHPEALDAARQWIEQTNAYWEAQLDALERYVEGLRELPGPEHEED